MTNKNVERASQARHRDDQRRARPARHRRAVLQHQAARPTFRHDRPRLHDALHGPAGNPPGTVGDYIDDVPPGSVSCSTTAAARTRTVWGDILTEVAHRRGIAGTVIDGAVPRRRAVPELGYPIFSHRPLDAHRQGSRAGRSDATFRSTSASARVAARRHPARRRRRRGRDSARARRRGARRGRDDPAAEDAIREAAAAACAWSKRASSSATTLRRERNDDMKEPQILDLPTVRTAIRAPRSERW